MAWRSSGTFISRCRSRFTDGCAKAADRTNQPATTLARHAIERWLREHRRTLVREAVARYAAAAVGTGEDLDEALEAASLETWKDLDPPRKRRRRKQ
jgi:hypothetical protein